MRKKIIRLISIYMLLFLFMFNQEVSAEDSNFNQLEVPEELELLEIDLTGKEHEEVIFEEDDGTMATISFSRVDPLTNSQNGIVPFAVTKGKGYRYIYNGNTDRYSFVVWIHPNEYTIYKLDDLQYNWKNGKVRSTSLRRLSTLTGRAQLIIDTTLGGTKTETANVRLVKEGRGSSWHILVTRNGSSTGIKLRDKN